MDDADIRVCRKMATYYRERGFNPLPSRPDDKRPMLTYAELWEKPLSEKSFDAFSTSNIQVMTGRRWGLLVIDLDGEQAIEHFHTLGQCPRTWISHSGGGGRHVWFSVSRTGPPLTKGFLWKGEGEHSAIERLGDKSLVMAPPSIHPKTGERYVWLDRYNSPYLVAMPALAPNWLLRMPLLGAKPDETRRIVAPRPLTGPRTRREPWSDVIRRIPDIASLVRSWGVRTSGNVRKSGWISCYAIDRDDRRPSAAINTESGYYLDSGSGRRCGLIDLAVNLGVYPSPVSAIQDLETRYGSR